MRKMEASREDIDSKRHERVYKELSSEWIVDSLGCFVDKLINSSVRKSVDLVN